MTDLSYSDAEAKQTVLVIGEPMVELTATGGQNMPLYLASGFSKSFGGDALITACALANIMDKQIQVELLTGLADDAFGHELMDLCRKQQVGLTHSPVLPETITGLYMVGAPTEGMTTQQHHPAPAPGSPNPDDPPRWQTQRVGYYRSGSAASQLGLKHVPPNLLDNVAMVVASGIGLGVSPSMQQVIRKVFTDARKRGITTVLDPNYRPALWAQPSDALDALKQVLPLVDVVLPSMPDDTMALLGLEDPYRCMDMFHVYGAKLVVLKAGKGGCYLGFKRQAQHIPALEVRGAIQNTIGAGDVFNAGFLAGMLSKQPLTLCAKWANTVAGLKCQQAGTIAGIPTSDAFERQLALV